MRRYSLWKFATAFGAFAGASVAVVIVLGAWAHNPQGEFHGGEGIAWVELSIIGISWFIAVAGSVTLITAAAARVLLGKSQ